MSEKERRNFCEFFSFNPAPFKAASRGREDQARAGLEGLFGAKAPGESAGDRASDARRRLDALFGKPDSEPE